MELKGRLLEILTHHVQEFLAPEGVRIQSPKIFIRDGRRVAEVDVFISGNIGSAKISVGIECRGRPSGPRQGLPWIWEIWGKKQYLGINKMTEVVPKIRTSC